MLGSTTTASAVTLGECVGEECVCEEGTGYDYCAMTPLADIPYPDSPCEYREYLGVTVNYDDGQYNIHANIPADHRVTLTPQHGGNFATYQDLDTYIQKLLFGIGCPNAPIDWPKPDTCDPRTWNITQTGPIYRWTENPNIGNFGGYWSGYQPNNLRRTLRR